MGILSKMVLILSFLYSLFPGQAPKKAPETPTLVTQVEVTARHKGACLQRRYTDPHKMGSILLYLRALDTEGRAKTDPERVIGDSFRITVQLSTGEERIYLQRADRYLSKNLHCWMRVDPKEAKELYPLLQSTPSDP